MDTRYLSKFYKKSNGEKLTALKEAEAISSEDYKQLKENSLNLPPDIANRMIENYIMNYDKFCHQRERNAHSNGNGRAIGCRRCKQRR